MACASVTALWLTYPRRHGGRQLEPEVTSDNARVTLRRVYSLDGIPELRLACSHMLSAGHAWQHTYSSHLSMVFLLSLPVRGRCNNGAESMSQRGGDVVDRSTDKTGDRFWYVEIKQFEVRRWRETHLATSRYSWAGRSNRHVLRLWIYVVVW